MKKVLKLIILMKVGQENSFYWHDPTVRHRFVEKTVVALLATSETSNHNWMESLSHGPQVQIVKHPVLG